jgi:predicted ester cyclase
MTPKEVAEAMEAAYSAGDWTTVSQYLAEDFQYVMPGTTLPKEQVIFFAQLMRNAFPDINYNLHDFSVEGNLVRSKQQMSGTHTGPLDLSFMGMPVITPTGKSVTLPEENLTYTIENGKIVQIEAVSSGESGLPAVLRQLGIELPNFPSA